MSGENEWDAECGDGRPVSLSALLEGMYIGSPSQPPPLAPSQPPPLAPSQPTFTALSDVYDGAPFDEIAEKMKPITPDNGVLKAVTRCGQLSRSAPPMDNPNLWLLVKYTAYLDGNPDPFDIVAKKKKFWPDREDLLPGFRVALGSMRPLERSLFIFKPNYFYGELGCEPRIPSGGCSALFDIQLWDYGISKLPSEKAATTTEICLAERLALVNAMHAEGNSFYKNGQFEAAARTYERAIREMESVSARNQAERDRIDKSLLPLYLNAQQTCLSRGRYPHAVTLGKCALNIDEHNVKGLHRLGVAYRNLGRPKVAEYYLRRALRIEPGNKDIVSLLHDCSRG